MALDPAVVMALGGMVTGAGGLILSRRGQRDTDRQAVAAGELATRVQGYDELVKAYDRLEKQLERADTELNAMRIEGDRRSQTQAERCRTVLASAMETVHILQAVVRDEIAREAGAEMLDDLQRHQETSHREGP